MSANFGKKTSKQKRKEKRREMGFHPLTRKIRRKLDHVLVQGFDSAGNLVEDCKSAVKKDGEWFTPGMAKKWLKGQGCVSFKRINVWENLNDAKASRDTVRGAS